MWEYPSDPRERRLGPADWMAIIILLAKYADQLSAQEGAWLAALQTREWVSETDYSRLSRIRGRIWP